MTDDKNEKRSCTIMTLIERTLLFLGLAKLVGYRITSIVERRCYLISVLQRLHTWGEMINDIFSKSLCIRAYKKPSTY